MQTRDTAIPLPSQHKLLLPFLTSTKKEEELKFLHNHYIGLNKEEAIFYLALRLNVSLADSYLTIALKWFSWFTTWRLFLLRDGREHNVFRHIYSVSCYGYTTILQFSYALELIPCMIQLFNNPDMADDNEWQSTFTNALVWLIVNIWSVTTGYAWINLIGFAFDIWHDWYYTNNEIKLLQAFLTKLSLEEDCSEETKRNINAKIKKLQYKQQRVTIVAIGIFIGMAIFYLNPIAPGWVPTLGASLVILFGGIIGNLGNRLFQWDKLLINLRGDSPWKKIWDDELEAVLNSIGKLFKELIKPLFPTLWDSLGNSLEKAPITALLCTISAALPVLALTYACCHFSILFCFVSAHVLLTIGMMLVAAELCVRLCVYFLAPTQPEKSPSVKRIDLIINKLEEDLRSNTLGNPEGYFHAFCTLSQAERETLAKLAELSVTELLHHINCWDKNLGAAKPKRSSSSKTSDLRLSTCSYSFLKFKEKIIAEKAYLPLSKSKEKNDPPIQPLPRALSITVKEQPDKKDNFVPSTPSILITPSSSEVPLTPITGEYPGRSFSESTLTTSTNKRDVSGISRSTSTPSSKTNNCSSTRTSFWNRLMTITPFKKSDSSGHTAAVNQSP